MLAVFLLKFIHNLYYNKSVSKTSNNNYKMPSSSLNKSNMAKCSKIASQLQRMGDDLNKRGNSSSSSNKSSGFGKSNKGGLSSKSSLSTSKPSGSLFTSRRFWLLKTFHHFSRQENFIVEILCCSCEYVSCLKHWIINCTKQYSNVWKR